MAVPTYNVVIKYVADLIRMTSAVYKFSRITADTLVKSGSGRIHTIMVGSVTTGGTVLLYDGTDTTGTLISTMIIRESEMPTSVLLDIKTDTGIYVDFGTAVCEITVTWL